MWLLIPVALTCSPRVVSWLRARPRRAPGTGESMRAHGDYLDALVADGPIAGTAARTRSS